MPRQHFVLLACALRRDREFVRNKQ